MGTQFQIVLYASDEKQAEMAANEAFEHVEELNRILSDYVDGSELNSLSQSSGSVEAIPVSEPLFHILESSLRFSEITDGMFDISMGPYTHKWRELRREIEPELPDKNELVEAREKVGYNYIELDPDNCSVILKHKGMQLDPGGIAKGYAADEVLGILNKHNIHSALVNAGGDIKIGQPPPDRNFWNVTVPLPREENSYEFLELQMSDMAVSTSGNMFQFIEIDGQKYSHIIDPRTGLGVTRQVQVTVIAPDGISADALASAFNIMDPESGIELADQLEGVEAFIEEAGKDGIKTWKSKGFDNFVK
jgi:FAD:protein FMN transferase